MKNKVSFSLNKKLLLKEKNIKKAIIAFNEFDLSPVTIIEKSIKTETNNSGGIQGGISNGEDILLRVAFKPTATIRKDQRTIDAQGKATTLVAKGRHDPCVLPRAVPMVEAMVALVLADHLLRHMGQCSLL